MVDNNSARTDSASSPGSALNASMRRLIEAVRTAKIPPEVSAEATRLVDLVTDMVSAHFVDDTRMQSFLSSEEAAEMLAAMARASESTVGAQGAASAVAGGRTIGDIFRYSPIVGDLNPISAPAELWAVDVDSGGDQGAAGGGESSEDFAPSKEVRGRGTFPTSYNGPPDAIHGGFVAAILDEVLGASCMVNDLGAFTGTLTITYRKPSPLNTEITMKGRVDGIEGRKVFASGELYLDDDVLAEAQGIFVRSVALSAGSD